MEKSTYTKPVLVSHGKVKNVTLMPPPVSPIGP